MVCGVWCVVRGVCGVCGGECGECGGGERGGVGGGGGGGHVFFSLYVRSHTISFTRAHCMRVRLCHDLQYCALSIHAFKGLRGLSYANNAVRSRCLSA